MAYSKVGIAIPNVTGDIDIVVTTAAKEVTNLFNVDEATLNMRLGSSSESALDGGYITGFIDAVAGDVFYVKPAVYDSSQEFNKVNCYNSTSDTKIGARVLGNAESSSETVFTVESGIGHFTVPAVSGTTRVRIGLQFNTTKVAITKADLANVIITKNQPIEVVSNRNRNPPKRSVIPWQVYTVERDLKLSSNKS